MMWLKDDSKSKYIEYGLLAVILAVTFVLSVKQLFPLSSFDEAEMMNWAKDLEKDLFPGRKFPPLFLYLHFLLSWIYRGVLAFLGVIETTTGFLDTESGFRLTVEAGRVLSAVFGTLTVFFTYKTGKRFFNTATGFAAAALLACNGLVILYSHIFRPDILVSLLMILSVYYLLGYLENAKPAHLFLSAFFYGLSVAGKFNVFPVILAIGFAVLLGPKKKEGMQKTLPKTFFLLLAGVAAGFFTGAPNWLINPIGNINKFFMQYSPQDGMIFKPYVITSPLGTFGEVVSDLSGYFGSVFIALLFIGILIAFLARSKKEMVISVWIVSYFLLLGIFGFYASRYGLPPYPLMALLMAKVLFVDLKKLFERFPKKEAVRTGWKYAAVVLGVVIGINALFHTAGNIKSYNLLETQLSWDRTLEYRQQHNLLEKRFNIGRQIYTPKIPKRNIKLTKRFYFKFERRDSQKKMHFVQAHLDTYTGFMQDEEWRSDPRTVNLDQHRPFYRIEKREYQPWHPESIFLYLPSPGLAEIRPPGQPGPIHLPRPFYPGEHTTYLPLQVYEKNPGFGRLSGKLYVHRLHSQRKIKKLIFKLFSPKQTSDLSITVNNCEWTVKNEIRPAIKVVELDNLRPKVFFHDYVYHIEIHPLAERVTADPYYFVMEPVFEDEQEIVPFKLQEPVQGDIPRLYSGDTCPGWVKEAYRETGVDLSLLTHVRKQVLFNNDTGSIGDIAIDYFPLEKGHYRIHLTWEKLMAEHPFGEGAYLEYTSWDSTGKIVEQVVLTADSWPEIPIVVSDPLVFMKVEIKGLRAANRLVHRVSLTPDFREYLNDKR